MLTPFLYKPTFGKGSMSFLLCLFLAFTCQSSLAQWVQTSYSFYSLPGENDNGYTRYEDGAHINIGKIISSASNGYGTWAVDDSARWYLFANNLGSESIALRTPSGVIAQGLLPSTSANGYSYHSNEMKVVCNTRGSVRFVAPGHDSSGSRTVFAVFGFDEGVGVGAPEHRLELNFNGLPKTLPANDVEQSLVFIKDQLSNNSVTINSYPVIATWDTNASHSITSAQAKWQDQFDVAMDGKYLYLTWEWLHVNTALNVTTRRIMASVVLLSTGLVEVPNSWPQQLTFGGHQSRPTVACDVRRVPSAPIFELANITEGSDYHGIVLRSFNNGWTSEVLSNKARPYPEVIPTDVETYDESFAHARVVVASASGATAPRKVVYAIGHIQGGDASGAMYIYDRLHITDPTWRKRPRMVQDAFIDIHASYRFDVATQHSPLSATTDFNVVNMPIVAFANPYDGEGNSSYNEFHCVYQLISQTVGDTTNAIVACRTIDNGVYTTTDSRTVVSRKFVGNQWILSPKPTLGEFTASVNQAGIHVHWKDKYSNTHLYNRDQRKFDEDIEENTVVTYNQLVANNPQDSSPARILPDKKVVLWTDPHFGVTDTTQGLYVRSAQPFLFPDLNAARLVFPTSENAEFHVGNDNSTDNGATLIAFPNTAIQFSQFSGSTQRLVVNQASTLDWYSSVNTTYSTAQIQPGNANTYGFGTIKFEGDSAVMVGGSHGYPSNLIRPANLIVHGGSILGIGDGVIFEATNSLLDFKYEKHVEPVFNTADTTINVKTAGKLLVRGKGDLLNSVIKGHNSHISFNSPAPIITVRPATNPTEAPADQFTATNCRFTNDASNRSQIVFEGDLGTIDTVSQHYRDVLFSGGAYDGGMEILAMDPLDMYDFTIQYGRFDNLKKKAIHFRRTEGLDYDHILVSDNVFWGTSLSSSDWITFDGFDMNHQYHTQHVSDAQVIYYIPHNRIMILGSLMETARGASHNNIVGIRLVNSAAAVAYNTITADDYKYGIWQNDTATVGLRKSSFFCSNIIANCNEGGNGAGIRTENWFGFSKMNEISNSDAGHLSGNRDFGGIVFSDIHDNVGAGLKFLTTTAVNHIDIRGVIPAGPYYSGAPYAAKNTFDSNNTAGVTGQIEVSSSSDLVMGDWDDVLETTSKNFAKNNLIRTGTTDDFIYYSGDSINVGNIDSNYWENGNSTAYTPPATASDPPFDNVWYTSAIPVATGPFTVGNVVCSSGVPSNEGKAEDKGQQPMSFPLEDTSCLSFKLGAGTRVNQGKYQEAYELYQRYFELCAVEDKDSWKQFGGIGAANEGRSSDNTRFAEFREWLKTVLYYRLDTNYYCADVAEMLTTFYWFDSTRGRDYLGAIAVAKYVLESGKCSRPQDTAYFKNKGIEGNWYEYARHWEDTVKDSNLTPLDSTFPSLEDLDLTILYGPSEVVGEREIRIGKIAAIRNPFTDLLELHYQLDRSAMTRIEICDVLGKPVYSEGQGYQDEGDHTVTLSTVDWPSGSYYVRLSTPSGEVKTVKVIKE
jgi:hypothetical protein